MKDIKELKPLWKLIKEEKNKLIIASILIFSVEIAEIFTGYLNGAAVESITNLEIKKALFYLGIYLLICIIFSSIIYTVANSILQKVEIDIILKLGVLL